MAYDPASIAAAGNAVFTDEQLQALLENGDITEAEQQMYRQQRMAAQLAKGVRRKGRDVGSNLARAFSGIGAAKYQYDARKKGEEISDMYRQLMDEMYGPKEPMVMPQGVPERNAVNEQARQRQAAIQGSQSTGPTDRREVMMRRMAGGPQPGPRGPAPSVTGPMPDMGPDPSLRTISQPANLNQQPLGDPPPSAQEQMMIELLRKKQGQPTPY
jgi:hypothetical protein